MFHAEWWCFDILQQQIPLHQLLNARAHRLIPLRYRRLLQHPVQQFRLQIQHLVKVLFSFSVCRTLHDVWDTWKIQLHSFLLNENVFSKCFNAWNVKTANVVRFRWHFGKCWHFTLKSQNVRFGLLCYNSLVHASSKFLSRCYQNYWFTLNPSTWKR